uniref:Birch protein n=1 Tax=Betula platyphylla TaxID=78630 RepID=A0A9E9L834_BETPL|nr:birch protein [Betula platyphylla]
MGKAVQRRKEGKKVPVRVPASGPAPLRRSTRRKPNPDAENRLSSVPVPPRQKRLYITKEESIRYREQVHTTGGFDVDLIPDINCCGFITPVDLSYEIMHSTCEKFSRLAIEEYLRRNYKRHPPVLEFVKVLKAMSQTCDLRRFYITFEAKDVADEGKHKTYEALVRRRAPPLHLKFDLIFMREYNQDKGDQVIHIHFPSELQMHLNAASMTSRLTILFFSATYPCLRYSKLAGKYPEVVFLEVYIYEVSDVAACWKANKVSTFFLLKNGEVVDKVVGLNLRALSLKIEHHSGKQARCELNLDKNMNSSVSCSLCV